MDTYSPQRPEEEWEGYDSEPDVPLSRRPRRRFLNPGTAALAALVTCAIGFYAGIRVEKNQLSNSTSALGSGAAAGARAAARAGASTRTAGPGPAGRFAGGGGAGGAASFGTVSSVNGKTLYVTDTSGNTVKVKLTPSTKITKTQSAGRKAIRPGDTIIVTGAPSSGGATTAASVTDSGNRSGASGSGSAGSGGAGGAGGAGGSGSAVGSLFSSGG
jgi:Domain of unknown function (DUF5666)